MALKVFTYICDMTSPCSIKTIPGPSGESLQSRPIEKLFQWSR